MATVIKARINSVNNTPYEAFLDNGAPTDAGLLLESKGASINFQLSGQDPDGRVMASKCSVQFEITSDTQAAVFAGLVQANEMQYRLRIHKDGALFWVGFVLLEQVVSDFDGYPYFFKVGATDGLSRLKDIPYKQGGLNDFVTVKEHLFNVLGNVPLSDYFAPGAEYLRANSTMFPEGLTPSTSVNLLDSTRLGFNALQTVDKTGEVKRSSCYAALVEFLTRMNGRLVFSAGRYVIVDISSYASPLTATTFFRYDQGGNALAYDAIASWSGSTVQMGSHLVNGEAYANAGGKKTHLAPLKAVKLVYKNYSRQNLLPGFTWDETVSPVAILGSLGTDGGAGRLRLSGNISFRAFSDSAAVPSTALYAIFAVRISVGPDGGEKYLKRQATVTPGGISYGETTWVDGVEQYEFVFGFSPPQALQFLETSISALSPPLPISGALKMTFFDVDIVNGNGFSLAGTDLLYQVDNVFLESILTGSISDQYNYLTFEPETGAGGFNSLVLEREVVFGDGPSENTFGRIEYTANGTDWLVADGWRRWSGGGYLNATAMPHGGLLARMILALQEAPREQLDITIVSTNYSPHFLIGDDTRLYLLKSGQLNLDRDTWRGRWFEIAENFVDTTVPGLPTVGSPIFGADDGQGVPEPEVTPGGGNTTPPIGGSPGNSAPGINTVPTTTDDGIATGDGIGGLSVNNLDDVPLYGGDIIVVTNPLTGETQQIEVLYDSGLGVPAVNQVSPPADAVPYYGAGGLVWLVPDTGEVSVVPVNATADFPAGSYIQPDPQFTARLQALLRTDHYDLQIFGYNDTVATGFTEPFWRPVNRVGWGIRKVSFSFAQDNGGTVKANLKYYDATGYRYTVATFNNTGLGESVDAFADVAIGYYRLQVETVTGAAPKGLAVSIQLIKKN